MHSKWQFRSCSSAVISSLFQPWSTWSSSRLKTILIRVRQFRVTGNLAPKKPRGLARLLRTVENIERMTTSVTTNPRSSVCRHLQAFQMNWEFWKMISSCIHTRVLLSSKYFPKIIPSGKILLKSIQVQDAHSALIFMSSVTHFHLIECSNSQNYRYWSANNLWIHQKWQCGELYGEQYFFEISNFRFGRFVTLIFRSGDVPWLPRSLDLSICTFFCGLLKGKKWLNDLNYLKDKGRVRFKTRREDGIFAI